MNNQNIISDQKDRVLENLINQDLQNSEQSLLSIDHRIAERRKLEYRNIIELERQRQRIEQALNSLSCWGYQPNPKMTMVRSGLETEMARLEIRKGEEAVNAFRDVEKLEYQRRKIVEEMRDDKSMMEISYGGIP